MAKKNMRGLEVKISTNLEVAMKAVYAIPIENKTKSQLWEDSCNAYKHITEKGYEMGNAPLTREEFSYEAFAKQGVKHNLLYVFAKKLEAMSKSDAVYFGKGWEYDSTTALEHEIAKAYGLKIEYEI